MTLGMDKDTSALKKSAIPSQKKLSKINQKQLQEFLLALKTIGEGLNLWGLYN